MTKTELQEVKRILRQAVKVLYFLFFLFCLGLVYTIVKSN
jgi:hypothetical protein